MNLKTNIMKTPEEMTSDILSSLNNKDAPERVLMECYLDIMIKRHRADAVAQYIAEQNKPKEDIEYKPSHG
jgi:hypothetical protein